MNAAQPTPALDAPEMYINRELSQLAFNERVLELACDERLPLLERLRFLCISSSNLDEFFEIRVAGLRQLVHGGATQPGPDGRTPAEVLDLVRDRARTLIDEQYRVFNDELIPALDAEQIRFLRREQWNAAQSDWLHLYFRTELMPLLTPIGIDPAHPFPRLLNKSLNFIVPVEGRDAFGRNASHAVLQAPRALPRLIRVPPQVEGTGPYDFVFLSSVIHAFVEELFPGMRVLGCYQFRVTRDSELAVDTEEVEDLAEALEGELPRRQWGGPVRLEVADNCPERLWRYLAQEHELGVEDVYRVDGPVNLNRLMAVPEMVDRADLKFRPFVPQVPRALQQEGLFAAIRAGDVLLHHPFDSFSPIVELLRAAAQDPSVLAIRQTLYRTGARSEVVDALELAARNGKEVTVVVELRARFDEADNIDLAERLQEAGAHVVYGVVGYKTHAKMLQIVRREADGLRQYVHLSTGNYHPQTARLYTDYGLLTADTTICDDVHSIFLALTGLGNTPDLRCLKQAPFTLHSFLHAAIDREVAHVQAGRPAGIVAKMNQLTDPGVIRALYRASQAGVDIHLQVRGTCCLRPGVPGVSDRITVHSTLGRFLEHTRAWHFRNGGQDEVWLSSADWMERNLFRRVEVAFPLRDPALRRRVARELAAYARDRAQSWALGPDGVWRRRARKGRSVPVQQRLLERRV